MGSEGEVSPEQVGAPTSVDDSTSDNLSNSAQKVASGTPKKKAKAKSKKKPKAKGEGGDGEATDGEEVVDADGTDADASQTPEAESAAEPSAAEPSAAGPPAAKPPTAEPPKEVTKLEVSAEKPTITTTAQPPEQLPPAEPAGEKQGQKKAAGFGPGQIKQELAGRAPFYVSDWTDGLQLKVLSATSYMFFASLAPAITLGAFLLREVEGRMGPIEVLMSSVICGVVFSVFAGQGMVIVGVTGPVCIFAQTVYKLSDSFDEPFLPWMGWIAIWACLMHVAIALAGACRLVSWVTAYACETFGSLIGIIYVWTAVADVVKYFEDCSRQSAMWSLIIAVGTHFTCDTLAHAREWSSFGPIFREQVSNYAVPISIISWTVLAIVVNDELDVDTPRIQVSDSFGPTMAGRDWLVKFGDCSAGGIILAIVPAAVLTVLFFFDHNVSSLMAQAPEFKLKKPPAYNWDFFVVGILILVCGVLGIPFTNGLIPQAPLHSMALSTLEQETNEDGLVTTKVARVAETRLSNCVHATMIGLCMTPPVLKVLQKVPLATLSGLFLFMGMGCFAGNGFVNRCFLVIQDPKKRSPVDYGNLETLLSTPIGQKEIMWFTVLQFCLWACIYSVTKTPAAISFPIWIASLVLVRWKVLPKLFSKEAIEAMDGKVEEEGVEDEPPPGHDGLGPKTGRVSYSFARETRESQQMNEGLLKYNDGVKQRASVRRSRLSMDVAAKKDMSNQPLTAIQELE